MYRFSLVVAAVLSGALALVPLPAHACSCTAEPIYNSNPMNNARNVVRDIAPVFEGPFDPSTIKLEDEHGAEVKFQLNLGPRLGCHGGWAELLPEHVLAANTRYTISVGALYPDLPPEQRVAVISFTTGTDELADKTLAAPQLTAASVLRGARDCGGTPTNMACIAGLEQASPNDLELIARRGDKVVLRITSLIQDDGNYGLEEAPDCIELRRRAIDGRRSEPTKICGDALPTRDFRESDLGSSGWVSCVDGILGERGAYDELRDAGVPADAAPRVVSDAEVADAAPAAVSDAAASDAGPPAAAPRAAGGCSVGATAARALSPFVLMLALCVLARRLRKPRDR